MASTEKQEAAQITTDRGSVTSFPVQGAISPVDYLHSVFASIFMFKISYIEPLTLLGSSLIHLPLD